MARGVETRPEDTGEHRIQRGDDREEPVELEELPSRRADEGDGSIASDRAPRSERADHREPARESVAGGGVLIDDPEEGRAYRSGVFEPIERDLEPAPTGPDYPDPGKGEPFHRADGISRVPKLRHVIGPSFVALGIGLGAGEFLLWPNLFAVNGFSIMWLFVIGVLAQFVVIGEIQRWTVATGESLFAGMARMTRVAFWPWFFVAAGLISFAWPGWASQSATFVLDAVNTIVGREVLTTWQPLAIGMLAFAWLVLALSQIVYNALERFEILLIAAFFPLLLVAAIAAGGVLAGAGDMARGAVTPSAPQAMLSGDQFPTLLIAVAYAGSGGVLLLGQTLWVRDKGFGLARHQGRIAGIRGANEPIVEPGWAFSTRTGLMAKRFQRWMRLVNLELLAAFVIPILVSVVLTGLVVAATIGLDNPDLAGDLTGMVTAQAEVLQERAGAWLAVLFVLGGALVLFSTQFGIMDTITRISGDIVYERLSKKGERFTIKTIFLTLLTILTLLSIGIVALSWYLGRAIEEGSGTLQPNFLIIIAGPFTIASMYAFACVIAVLNTRYLPAACRMTRTKLVSVWASIALWGWFTAEIVSRTVLKELLGVSGEEASSITAHPVRMGVYGFVAATLVYVIVRTAGPGFAMRRRGADDPAPA